MLVKRKRIVWALLLVVAPLFAASRVFSQDKAVDFSVLANRLEGAIVPILVGFTVEVPAKNGGVETHEAPPSSGTGFIVSEDGYIITCDHVVPDVYEVPIPDDPEGRKVSLAVREKKILILIKSGNVSNEYAAKVIQTSKSNDVALLKINAHNLPVIELGDSANVKPLQKVLVMGYPLAGELGMKHITLATGQISSIRDEGVIQISAAVNPGNSGGPLIDEQGKAIGVISAKLSGVGIEGINFARPINAAKGMILNAGVQLQPLPEGFSKRQEKDTPGDVALKPGAKERANVQAGGSSAAGKPDTARAAEDASAQQETSGSAWSGKSSHTMIFLIALIAVLGMGSVVTALFVYSGRKRGRGKPAPVPEPEPKPEPRPRHRPVLDVREYGNATISITKGNDAGKRYQVRHAETSLGREAAGDVIISDRQVSRLHAKIKATQGGFYLHHLSATNKTYLNGNPINTIRLENGDQIKMGDTVLEFRLM